MATAASVLMLPIMSDNIPFRPVKHGVQCPSVGTSIPVSGRVPDRLVPGISRGYSAEDAGHQTTYGFCRVPSNHVGVLPTRPDVYQLSASRHGGEWCCIAFKSRFLLSTHSMKQGLTVLYRPSSGKMFFGLRYLLLAPLHRIPTMDHVWPMRSQLGKPKRGPEWGERRLPPPNHKGP